MFSSKIFTDCKVVFQENVVQTWGYGTSYLNNQVNTRDIVGLTKVYNYQIYNHFTSTQKVNDNTWQIKNTQIRDSHGNVVKSYVPGDRKDFKRSDRAINFTLIDPKRESWVSIQTFVDDKYVLSTTTQTSEQIFITSEESKENFS